MQRGILSIRWMNAYRGRHIPVLECLQHEWESNSQVAAATTQADGGEMAKRQDLLVGLLVRPSAVIESYVGDVWSVTSHNGKITLTSGSNYGNPKTSPGKALGMSLTHASAWSRFYSESFVSHRKSGHERYEGLVIRCARGLRSKEAQAAISWAEERGLKVYVFNSGELQAYKK